MGTFVIRRLLLMVPTLLVISLISFAIIQLPPGDFLTTLLMNYQARGDVMSGELIDSLRVQYGLDSPVHVQYVKWLGNFVRGNMGYSFAWNKPVNTLIGERLLLTVIISLVTLIITYAIAIPIGIYSATHQYSAGDFVFSFLGFIGIATPSFLLALVLMFVSFRFFGQSVGGLFSPEFIEAPWSVARVVDLLKHLWIPVAIIGLSGTAGTIRVMRANLLDELKKQYVITARAKGVAESRLLFKYPIRVAINPIISTVGWILPHLISGATIVSIVLNLPTAGPLLLGSLMDQDMYLAGSFIMLLAILTVIGTFLSDLLLAVVDPRIRFGAAES